MRILFITRGSLIGSNNSGNTIINIFNGIQGLESFNLFMRSEKPNLHFCDATCQMSEVSLIKGVLKRENPIKISKKSIDQSDSSDDLSTEKEIYGKMRNKSSKIPWFFREFLWMLGTWKNNTLDEFLSDVDPQIIFMPAYGCWYPYRILSYVHNRLKNVPVMLYHFDDNYSYNQYSLYPSFWIYRFFLRRYIRKAEKYVDKSYVISESQKYDYEKFLNINFDILTKGSEYNEENKVNEITNEKIKFCYTGNIGDGRIDILIKLGNVLSKIGSAELDIYSTGTLNKNQADIIDGIDCMHFKGAIEPDKVRKIQEEANILVHVESFSKKNRLLAKYSISTKIFDYLNTDRCILAIGPDNIASIDFLKKNDAAAVVDNILNLEDTVKLLVKDSSVREKYKKNAWNFGKEHLDINNIQSTIVSDMKKLIKG